MITFSVKNFTKFQHYRDRTPPWIKLYNELLDDYEFGRLQDASKLHLIMIWLLASRADNVLPYDPEWVGKRINATEVVNLRVLVDAGFIETNQPLQSVEQSASTTLATCYTRERERGRGETEREAEAARASKLPASPPAEPERDIVGLLERACSLAGIKPTHAVNFLGIGKTWLGTGLTDEQILDAITAIVDRPGYTAKRTLAYFTQAITDHAEALKHSSHATAKPGESTPEQQQAAIDWYTERFAADGTWHPSIGPQPGQPGCRSSPGLLKRLGLPATPDAQDAAS
jgi:hypothetical protein